eukprot:1175743-Prorocentrum_minimum.AAC.4
MHPCLKEAEHEACRRCKTARQTDLHVMLAVGESGKSSGRKWGTGHRVRKGEGERWVLRAPLPSLAQEDPAARWKLLAVYTGRAYACDHDAGHCSVNGGTGSDGALSTLAHHTRGCRGSVTGVSRE